jgi:hypothetical protein
LLAILLTHFSFALFDSDPIIETADVVKVSFGAGLNADRRDSASAPATSLLARRKRGEAGAARSAAALS